MRPAALIASLVLAAAVVACGRDARAPGEAEVPGGERADVTASARVTVPSDVVRVVLEAIPAGTLVAANTRALLGSAVSAILPADGGGGVFGQIFLPAGAWDLYATALDARGTVLGRGMAANIAAGTSPTTTSVTISVLDWALWSGVPAPDPPVDPGPLIVGLSAPRSASVAAMAAGARPLFTVTAVDPDGGTPETAPSPLTYSWFAEPLPGSGDPCAISFTTPQAPATYAADSAVEECTVVVWVTETNGRYAEARFRFSALP